MERGMEVQERMDRRVRETIKSDDEPLEKWEVLLTRVTPPLAERWMQQDHQGNRNIRQNSVDEYARDMTAGNWDLATDAIAFNDQGRLLNGRHRLLAIIKSGVTITSIVLLGKSTMIDIDAGVARSSSDFFHLMGVGNSRRTAAVVRMIADWEINRLASQLNLKHSTSELWGVWERHPHLLRSIEYVQKFPQAKLVQVGRHSILMAFHYLFSLEDPSVADLYIDGVVTADGVRSNDPASVVRDRFIAIQIESAKKRVPNREWSHLLAKGWKATRDGKTIKQLRVQKSEAFPVLGPPLPKKGDVDDGDA